MNYQLKSAQSQITHSRTPCGVLFACDTLGNPLKVVPNISDRIVVHEIIGVLYNVLRNSNRSVCHRDLVQRNLNGHSLTVITSELTGMHCSRD